MRYSRDGMNGLRKKSRCCSIEYYEKYSVYENLCKSCEGLGINPWGNLEKKYKEAIIFSHLKVTPVGAFSLTVLATAFVIIIPAIYMWVFNMFYLGLFMLIGILGGIVSFFLYSYPMHYATMFRIKASSEMTLCILYMVTSMRISSNLEGAIHFAANNLRGPLAIDLKKLLWEIYVGRYTTESGLDMFMKKWERENEEFTRALYLIRNSPYSTHKKIEDILDESIDVILNGTKERMQEYARRLRTPVAVINALGIVLPLIGIVFFPLMAMFLPEVLQPLTLGIGYVILLPSIVYFLMKRYLEERPYTFHQPDISRHPKFRKEKLLNKELISTVAICFLISLTGFMILAPIKLVFSTEQLYLSLIVTWGVAAGVIFYCISTVRDKMQLRDEIIKIESEFSVALYHLGSRVTMGVPLENVLKEVIPKIKHLKISEFFKIIVNNMETFGMTLEEAAFNKQNGAIIYYPSTLIEAITKSIIDIQKKGGFTTLSKVLISISVYLKNMNTVEENLKDILGEETASLSLQSILLAPLTAGIVVALAAIIMQMLVMFGGMTDPLYQSVGGYGSFSDAGKGFITIFVNVNKMIPVHFFQIIVGIYKIEIVILMTVFLSIIENGDENIIMRNLVGKRLLISTILYSIILVLVYSTFSALIPIGPTT
jgi:hypothetical protein